MYCLCSMESCLFRLFLCCLSGQTFWDGLVVGSTTFLSSVRMHLSFPCRAHLCHDPELDTRSRLDYREYFEVKPFLPAVVILILLQVPTILFAALCYAFWLSFAQIGAPTIAPDIWLLLWLGLVGIVVLNPFPVGAKSSRYWLLKKAGKLLLSGATRVEVRTRSLYYPESPFSHGSHSLQISGLGR